MKTRLPIVAGAEPRWRRMLLPAGPASWFDGLVYRSFDHNLGAAHPVAQWARWKTVLSVSMGGDVVMRRLEVAAP